MTTSTVQAPALHLWTRADYDKMIDADIFQPSDRIELIEGELVDVAPQSPRHAAGVQFVGEALRAAVSLAYMVSTRRPIALGDTSEPEPGIAVVRGEPRDYADTHPETAGLIVEVADRSLEMDRGRKKRLYAGFGIREYWVLNLVQDCLEVYRRPAGEDYRDEAALHRGDAVSPLFCPDIPIAVADLLP